MRVRIEKPRVFFVHRDDADRTPDLETLGMWAFIQSLEEGAEDEDVCARFGITIETYHAVMLRLVDAGLVEIAENGYMEVTS